MAHEASARLELEDIQSGIIRARPSPYAAAYLMFRIDDGKAGRELMRRAGSVAASAADPRSPVGDAWATVALTFQGLRALGVPQNSLDSFAPEFQQGMAARARELRDTGESSPENWEKPLGTTNVHVVLAALAADVQRLRHFLGGEEYTLNRCLLAHAVLLIVAIRCRRDRWRSAVAAASSRSPSSR